MLYGTFCFGTSCFEEYRFDDGLSYELIETTRVYFGLAGSHLY